MTFASPPVSSPPSYHNFYFLCFVGLSFCFPCYPEAYGRENGEHTEGSSSASRNPRPLAESVTGMEDGGDIPVGRVCVAFPLADLLLMLLAICDALLNATISDSTTYMRPLFALLHICVSDNCAPSQPDQHEPKLVLALCNSNSR